MDKYTDFTHPNQPINPNRYKKPPWLKYSEEYPSPLFLDTPLRILLNRMLLGAAPPAETWNKILNWVRSLNHGGCS